jgi:methylmalonyl-CoA/ethylmalonyl-CoA epimerase
MIKSINMKLHHVGIVVPNIQESLGEIKKYLTFEEISIPSLVRSQKVNVCFLKVGDSHIEFIEPNSNDSPIFNFVKSGGGYHHLCFEVKDIHKELEELKKKGATVIVEPIKGFENRLIAFVILNMKNTKCNLIELAEEEKLGNGKTSS